MRLNYSTKGKPKKIMSNFQPAKIIRNKIIKKNLKRIKRKNKMRVYLKRMKFKFNTQKKP
jgi:hypothetical protein